jgi:hypothetical protein
MRAEIAEMLAREPNASLRTIASRLDVSPETVRSVRHQLDPPNGSSAQATAALDEITVARLLALHHRPEPPTPWRRDNAFGATDTGASFVEWFDSTIVAEEPCRVDEVPLSRVYEIADEARRRSRYWARFAERLELRTRGRR